MGVGIWTQKADFGGEARSDAVGFSIGNKGYIGTGRNYYGYDIYYKDFWEYDPSTNTWTQKADFGGIARFGAVGFSIGNKAYIGTGYSSYSGFCGDFWEYNPSTNTWTRKADFGGEARAYAVGFSIGNKGYIGTGYSSYSGFCGDFWEYDPSTNTWTQKADFGGGVRQSAVGFSIGIKGYIGTGYDGSGYFKDFWEYDPSTNTWTQKADFGGIARFWAVGFSIGNKGYISTGYGLGSCKDFWEYDPSTNTWTQKADFGGAERFGAVGFSIGTKGYIGTGYDSNYDCLKDFWEYDPGDEIINDKLIVKIDYPETDNVVQVPFTVRGLCWNSEGGGIDCYNLVLIEDTDGDGVISADEFANKKIIHRQKNPCRFDRENSPLTFRYKMSSELLEQNKKYFLFVYAVDPDGRVSASTDLIGLTKNGDATRTKDMLKYFTVKGRRP